MCRRQIWSILPKFSNSICRPTFTPIYLAQILIIHFGIILTAHSFISSFTSLKHHPTLSMGGCSSSSSLGWSQYRIIFFQCLIIYILILFIYNLIFSPIHLYPYFNNLILIIDIHWFKYFVLWVPQSYHFFSFFFHLSIIHRFK